MRRSVAADLCTYPQLTGRTLVTAPTEEPVTRALAIAHLRDNPDTDQADYIDQLIPSAREVVEEKLWRSLCTQTWDFFFEAFPCGDIDVPLAPLRSVASISYVDADGVSQTLSSSLYSVDATSEPGRIRPAYNEVWPATRDSTMKAVTVRAVCGYGSAANVPYKVKQAILLVVGDYFNNRESVVVGTISSRIEGALDSLLADHMRPVIG